MPHTTAGCNAMLDAIAVTHASLHSAFPGTTGANELSGGSPAYARQAVTFGAAANKARTQSGTATFDVPAGSTLRWVGFWTAATGGSLRSYHPVGGQAAREFITDLATDTLRCTAHGYANGDQVVICGDTVQGGLSEGTIYFVISAATDTFQLAATSGGAAIDLTSLAGAAAQVIRIVPETFASQGQAIVSGCALNLLF
jgi:hypothetical protein